MEGSATVFCDFVDSYERIIRLPSAKIWNKTHKSIQGNTSFANNIVSILCSRNDSTSTVSVEETTLNETEHAWINCLNFSLCSSVSKSYKSHTASRFLAWKNSCERPPVSRNMPNLGYCLNKKDY